MINQKDLGFHPSRIQEKYSLLEWAIDEYEARIKKSLAHLNVDIESLKGAVEKMTIIKLYMKQENICPEEE